MKRLLLTLTFLSLFSSVYSCECGKRSGGSFLRNLKKFDLVIFGSTQSDDSEIVIIDQVLKGDYSDKTIDVGARSFCDVILSFEPSQKIIVGVVNNEEYYFVPGCITSLLLVDQEVIYGNKQLRVKGRVGLFSKRMSLRKFKDKLKM